MKQRKPIIYVHTAGILWHPRSLSGDLSRAAIWGRLKCALLNLSTAFELTISLLREEESIPVVCTSFAFVFRGLPFILPASQTLQVFCGLCWLWAFLFGIQWLAHNTLLWATLWWSRTSCLPVNPKPCIFKTGLRGYACELPHIFPYLLAYSVCWQPCW